VTTSYSLRYRVAGSGEDDWSAAVPVSGTSHELTGLSPGVRYDVEVTAISGGVNSAPVVAQRSTRCAAPSQPVVLPTGYAIDDGDPETDGGLDASWGAVTGAVAYEVRRRLAGTGSYEPVATVSAPATSLAMSGLDGTVSYDVEVAAINVDEDASAASTARTGVPARIASGGTVTTFAADGTNGTAGTTYVVHTFATVGSSTFVLNRDRTVDYLVAAGGGGGGSDNAGGGGGGGVLAGSGISVTADHPIVVGAGGAPSGDNNKNLQTNGGNSSFSGLTAFGGGQGGDGEPGARTATTGGSGGGGHGERFLVAGAPSALGAAGTVGQGFKGGDGNRSATAGFGDGGGGGGAGAAGGDAAPLPAGPGDGGTGLASNITGTTFRYGSGGGGGTHRDTSTSRRSGAGGTRLGGGGGGSLGDVNGGNGEDGFGGGGGGSATTSYSGGAGGSGTVILRYALPE